MVPLILMLVLTLAGCGSPAPVKPDRFYALDPASLESPVGQPLPTVLLVNDLAARGFIGGRQIIFRTAESPLRVQRYQDLLWAEPVPRAIARGLADAIRAAGVFQTVIIPADRGRADLILSGEVERFEHLPTATPPRVQGRLNLTLVRADDRRSIQSRGYSGEEEVTGTTPEAMAEAFNRLTARLIAEVVRDLRAAGVRAGGPPRGS